MSGKIRIGFIGVGGIALSNHMPAFASMPDRCEIAAVCDFNEEKARAAADQFCAKGVYAKHEDMLSGCELDAVVVATPNRFHVEPTIDSLREGKHVLCEKPLATSGADARKMCAAARDAGKLLQVGLQTRFSGPSQFLKGYVDDGEMGPIYFARPQALRRRGVPGWGSFIDKEAQGGGPLIDIGVHLLDLTLWIMGYPKPISASGQTWNRLGTNPKLYNSMGDYDRTKFTVEDFAVGFIRFENGAVISLEASFMGNSDGHHQVQFFGEKSGVFIKPFAEVEPIKIYTEEKKRLFDMVPANIPKIAAPHIEAAKAFLSSIENGTPSSIPGENGMTLNAIFDALYSSAESGREEKVITEF